MYSILDRYIGRTIFCNTIIVLIILISLSTVIKFVDELRKIGRGSYGVLESGIYVLLNIMKDVEMFLPIAILLGAILGIGVLATHNELMIMEIFGFSRFQIIYSLVVKTAFPLILFGLLVNEWVAPISDRIARNYRYKMINNVSDVVYSNLWMKNNDDFIYIEKIVQNNELFGVHIYHFDTKKKLKIFCYASRAIFDKDIWKLLDVRKLCFHDHLHGIVKMQFSEDVWLTNINPDYLLMLVKSIYYFNSLSVFDLYRCIQFFKDSGQNMSQYQLRFWRKIFFPLSIVVMILTALSCVMRLLLSKLHIGIQILIGIIYSFFFIF